MSTLQGVLVAVGAIALAVCVVVFHGSVRSRNTTVQGRTATLAKVGDVLLSISEPWSTRYVSLSVLTASLA